jgi:hypothetical protein
VEDSTLFGFCVEKIDKKDLSEDSMASMGRSLAREVGQPERLASHEPNAENSGFMIKALPTNRGVVILTDSNNIEVAELQGFPLAPGELVCIDVWNLNTLFCVGEVGDGVAWLRVIM